MATAPTRYHWPDLALSRALPSIQFDRWKVTIQSTTDIDKLFHVVATYLGAWTPAQLATLPPELSSPVLNGSADLMARAVIASRAEMQYKGDARHYPMLREMSLTLLASASRLRYLEAVRAGRA